MTKIAGSYSEHLINAVKYLIMKGITKPSEIAKRLDISPYTARNVKRLLKQRGDLPEPNSLWKNRGRKPKALSKDETKPKTQPREKKRQRDVADALLEALGIE